MWKQELNAYLMLKGDNNGMFISHLRLWKSLSFPFCWEGPLQDTAWRCHRRSACILNTVNTALLGHAGVIATKTCSCSRKTCQCIKIAPLSSLVEKAGWLKHFIYWFCKPQGHWTQLQRGNHSSPFQSSLKQLQKLIISDMFMSAIINHHHKLLSAARQAAVQGGLVLTGGCRRAGYELTKG